MPRHFWFFLLYALTPLAHASDVYVGGHLGYNMNAWHLKTYTYGTDTRDASHISSQSFAGGGHLGGSWTPAPLAFALEGRYTGLHAKGTKETNGQLGGYTLGHHLSLKNLWDISLLWGYMLQPRTIIYLRTGLAFVSCKIKTYGDWGNGINSHHKKGFMGGIGLRKNWQYFYLSAEYSLSRFGSFSQSPINDFQVTTHRLHIKPCVVQLMLFTVGFRQAFPQ